MSILSPVSLQNRAWGSFMYWHFPGSVIPEEWGKRGLRLEDRKKSIREVTMHHRLIPMSSERPPGASGTLTCLSRERKRVLALTYGSLVSLPQQVFTLFYFQVTHAWEVSDLDVLHSSEATRMFQEGRQEASIMNLGKVPLGVYPLYEGLATAILVDPIMCTGYSGNNSNPALWLQKQGQYCQGWAGLTARQLHQT